MDRSQPGKPFFLTASATLQASAEGAGNVEALRNPYPVPVEVVEIRWQLRNTTSVAATEVITGAAVGCQLMLGAHPLTQAFVPVNCFGPARNWASEPTSGTVSSVNLNFLDFSFRPSTPILLPGKALLAPKFRHTGLRDTEIVVRISYVCRVAAKNRKKIVLPYVAAFTSKAFSLFSTSADSDQSTEADLVNALDVPIDVERFCGRLTHYETGFASLQYRERAPDAALRLLRVRMESSMGETPIRDFATFGQVFYYHTKTWEVRHQLPPKAFYSVTVDKLAVAVDPSLPANTHAHISLVGSREIGRVS